MNQFWLLILLLALCFGVSFLLSGMEAGVFALSRLRIRNQMRRGGEAARQLNRHLDDPEKFLWTILVGNTLANFVILSVAALFLHKWLANNPVILIATFGVGVLLFYALFDLLPKLLFRLFPNRLCLALVRPFGLIHYALSPLVRVLETCSDLVLRVTGGREFKGHLFGSRDELRLVMQESAQNFTTEERAMINRVLDLQSLTVKQITVPIEQAVTVTRDTPLSQALAVCRERGFSRLPVWDSAADGRRIVGLLNLRKLLFAENLDVARPAGDHLAPALYLESDLRVEAALKRMQKGGQRLAIVLGLDKKEIGIVSVQDMLKTIFGEVQL